MATRIGDVLRALPSRLRIDGAAKQSIEVARHRLVVAGVLFVIAFLIVGLRLVDVTLLKEAREPRFAHAPRAGHLEMGRADIVDRNGVLLATSLATASLYANPKLVLGPAEAARKLARVLPGLDEREIAARLASDRSFVWLRRNLPPRQQYEVNRLGIPGLYFQREERRVYPHGPLAAHIVGFTDIDNRGIAGIEQSFDEKLRESGEPLDLSIDIRIQHIVREELGRTVEEFKALGGAAIMLDVATGEVLAMVSWPDFDPNAPALAPADARFNRNTLGIYEMGSTFKIFTAAMALDYGTATLRDGYDATKSIQIGRFTISDFHAQRRYLTVPEIFIYSSNIGAVKMALDIGTQRQRDFLARVGLLKASPIELPEVGPPLVPQPWREVNTMTIAFGHGLSVSPIQLAAASAATINGGVMRPATILKRQMGEPIPGERVMSAVASEQMRRLMRLNVERGSGKSAAVPGYLVGGKTGTAEKIVDGRYKKAARISSFVGAFPMNKPRYIVLAILDEPQGTKTTFGFATGSWVAAPVVGRVIARAAPMLGIEPVDEEAPDLRDQMLINVAKR
ncbi:MAG: penicillin-binding protein 2 [Rhodospirillales bacterium]|nr:penicillin-binding protein 2 [Rhodospirillales bacterium]